MSSEIKLPVSLKVVAWLFIVGGIMSVIEVVVSLLAGRININLGILGIFIGWGLLNLRLGWRICALVFIWIGLILIPIAIVLMMAASGPLNLTFFGQKVGYAGKPFALIMGLGMFAYTYWQYRVLTRDDVKGLFGVA